MLGGYELRGITRERSDDLRELVHTIYVLQGWAEALDYFKSVGATPAYA